MLTIPRCRAFCSLPVGGDNVNLYAQQLVSAHKIIFFYEALPGGVSALRAYSQPLEIVLNVPCWEGLLDLIALPVTGLGRALASFGENDYIRKAAEWGAQGIITARTGMDMAAAAAVALMGDRMDIIVDVHAPKIVFPEEAGEGGAGFLVLDLGRAQLNGSVDSISGLTLTLNVASLCVGLPTRLEDIYEAAEHGVYFIRPVDVRVKFTAIAVGSLFQAEEFKKNERAPDLQIDMQLRSELHITLNSYKILRLIDRMRAFVAFLGSIERSFQEVADVAVFTPNEKLSRGVTYINEVLDPLNMASRPTNPSSVAFVQTKKKKFTERAKSIFGKMMRAITGGTKQGGKEDPTAAYAEAAVAAGVDTGVPEGEEEATSTMESLGLNVGRYRLYLPSPLRRQIELAIAAPALRLDVAYEYSTVGASSASGRSQKVAREEAMQLRIFDIAVDVTKRPCDRKVVVRVGSLTLEDSLRPHSQRFLILSRNLTSDGVPCGPSDHHDDGSTINSTITMTQTGWSKTEWDAAAFPSTDGTKRDWFTRISVIQLFDRKSPHKTRIDAVAAEAVTLRPPTSAADRAPIAMAAGLDEDLEIWSSGLKLSVDANAIKHMHAIFEPAFGRLFGEESVTSRPTASPAMRNRGATGAKVEMRFDTRRAALVGSLWLLMKAGREREVEMRAAEGKDPGDADDEEDFHSSRIKWARTLLELRGRCLLLIRVHVQCVTVDVIKVRFVPCFPQSPPSNVVVRCFLYCGRAPRRSTTRRSPLGRPSSSPCCACTSSATPSTP